MATTQSSRSYWNATGSATAFPRLTANHNVDIVIVGGGIVGITTARLLKDRGLSVAVVEAHQVGQQVTGKSTAKVTSQHSLIYQTLEQKFSERHARIYAEAQEAGVQLIRSLVERHNISCDLEGSPAYTYTLDPDRASQIEKEVEVAQRLGLPATLVHTCDLPYDIVAAIRYDHQMQFHPTDYVAGLARTIPGDNCHVFEHSRVVDWSPTQVITSEGSVTARHVVMATHLPLGQVGAYYARAFPNAEPVIAARIGRSLQGMYLNVENPSHSIRTHHHESGDWYAVVAGTSFKPGHPDEERRHFKELEAWLSKHFEVGPIEYRWVNEDYSSMDNVPFVGWSTSLGGSYLIATGFAAWASATAPLPLSC